jgi:hypothetical protein
MKKRIAASFLNRIKSWQLIGLGISGWVTLYSVAILSCDAGSFVVGNAQGGCFAVTMTLASLEARRLKQDSAAPVDPLQLIHGVTTQQLNQTIALFMQRQEFIIEPTKPGAAQMGFGVRAVNSGRTLVFETGRWHEPFIDLPHAQTTEENRKAVHADLAIIVSAGMPLEDVHAFADTHAVQLFIGEEFKKLAVAAQSQNQAT